MCDIFKMKGWKTIREFKSEEISSAYDLVSIKHPDYAGELILKEWERHFICKNAPYATLRKGTKTVMFVDKVTNEPGL